MRPDIADLTGEAALAVLKRAALAGGEAAKRHYRRGATTTARIDYKSGGSPVTEADLAADAAIRAVLAADFPEAAIFSEEAPGEAGRFDRRPLIVVDPIDGTRAFMQGGDEWCVSIALMRDRRALAGVVHAPARAETFAARLGGGAFLNGRRLTPENGPETSDIRIAGPKAILGRMAADDARLIPQPPLRALAYRLAAVAGGALDAAIASSGAHDWDIAAADIILSEAGCLMIDPRGALPVYNAADPVHPALVAAPGGLARRLAPALAGVLARS